LKAVILAGGRGTRLSEETLIKPKPLVEAGGKPLLWHIMQNYARFGVSEFIILVGYKGDLIREYFSNFWLHQSDVTFDLASPGKEIHQAGGVPWKVTVVETGIDTMTAGRLLKAKHLLGSSFYLTYGDGIATVNIADLKVSHQESGCLATLTAVQPPARFGALNLKLNLVQSFEEKPTGDGAWINGGFLVLQSTIFEFLTDDSQSLEYDVLPKLALTQELNAYFHEGYWQPVDTLRDLFRLERAIEAGELPWI
jgi:glucose-1-phosphate cytidylyltransferase